MADLFKPYRIGGLEIRNRLVRSATTSAWADERGVYLGRGGAIMEPSGTLPPVYFNSSFLIRDKATVTTCDLS